MINRWFVFVLSILVSFGAEAAQPITSLEYTPEKKIPLFDDGRSFVLRVGDIEVVGVDVGPLDGAPMIFSPGLAMSFPYLKAVVDAANLEGIRVFTFNPPGQGRGELESGKGTAVENLGADGAIKILAALRGQVFKISRGQPVIMAGHSLGGIMVRAASLGLVFSEDGVASVSATARTRARKETAMIVPMFSLALSDPRIWANMAPFKSKSFNIVPGLVDCIATCGMYIPNRLNLRNMIVSMPIRLLQSGYLKGKYGAADLDSELLDQLNHFILPQNISKWIIADLARWARENAYSTSSGLDFGKEWRELQSSPHPVPVLYFGGEHDSITELSPFVDEAATEPYSKMLVFPVGHLGTFLDKILPVTIAGTIKRSYLRIRAVGCDRWLAVSPKL